MPSPADQLSLDEPLLSIYDNGSQYRLILPYQGVGVATLAATSFSGQLTGMQFQTARNDAFLQPVDGSDDTPPTSANQDTLSDSTAPVPYQRSIYQPSRRAGPAALIASAGTVLALVAGLMTINVVTQHRNEHRLTVMQVRELDTKQKAPPAPQKIEQVVEKPPVNFIPLPKIQVPSPGPVKIAIDAPPPPPVMVSRVAAPAAVSANTTSGPAASSTMDGGDLSGTVLYMQPPTYPVESRRRHEQGTVRLLVLVGTDGRVSDISVAESSGSKRLDRAALTAVRRWRWTPAKREGGPVTVLGSVTIPFVLQEKASS